ncbi:MAG: 50S ribosomal protein L25 [Myxococcota bacterium]
MERLALEVSAREGRGKGAARRLRATGQVPAILYGSGSDPVPLAVDAHLLDRVLLEGANSVLDLQGSGTSQGTLALVKELQRDPVSRRVLHCDLYVIDVQKKVTVTVQVHCEGRAVGVELHGGVLDTLIREVEVSCLPLEIPDAFTLDVSGLEIGDALRASDLSLPEGVELLADPDLTIVHVVAPRVEEEAEAAEGEEAVEGVAPEVEADAGTGSEGSGEE